MVLGSTHQADCPPEALIVAALGRRSVVLVGMMGAGKSSIGRRLALRLGIPFVDADTEIEKAAGMTIPDIFATHGEAEFRAGEARVIARLLEGGPQVLATGGGAFMNADTRAAIAAKGISVWLKAEFDVLMRRIKRRHDRPLLKTDDPGATLRGLMRAALSGLWRWPISPCSRARCRTTRSSTRSCARSRPSWARRGAELRPPREIARHDRAAARRAIRSSSMSRSASAATTS